MESITQSPQLALSTKDALNELGLFSSGAGLNILKLILAGSPLPRCSRSLLNWSNLAETAHSALSGFRTMMESNFIAPRRQAFPDSLLRQGQCLLAPRVDLVAQLFIEGSQYMQATFSKTLFGIIIVTGFCLLEFVQCGRGHCLRARVKPSERLPFIIVKCAALTTPI